MELLIPLDQSHHLDCGLRERATWITSDSLIASVCPSSSGRGCKITGHAVGTCQVKVSVGDREAIIDVRVGPPVIHHGQLRLVGRDIPA